MKVKKYLPSLITLANLFLGFLSLLFIHQGQLIIGCYLILVSAGLDSLDGKLARKIGVASSFGKEIDSLADLISFCLAPSFLIFVLFELKLEMLSSDLLFYYLAIISSLPVLMGAIRLARFNVTHSEESQSRYFVGLPSPMAAITICAITLLTLFGLEEDSNFLIVNNYEIAQNIISSFIILISFLMVSKIQFVKFPLFSFSIDKKNSTRLILLFMSIIIIIISMIYNYLHITLFCFSIYYILSNTILYFINNSIKLNELKMKLKNKKRVQ